MGEKERRKRAARAYQEGRQAYQDGLPLDANPYKISDWGVGGFWRMGWEGAARSDTPERTDGDG